MVIERRAALPATLQAAVRRLVADNDPPPLNDQTLAQLGESRPGLVHVTAVDADTLTGYAQLDGDTTEIAGGAEIVGELLAAVEEAAGPDLAVWAHGRRSPVLPAAEARGYRRVRELWQLRRPAGPAPDVPLPEGVTIRAFEPGRDEDAWLAVNAAAFATHPEQGRLTRHDLATREAEPWFDPAGFLLATRPDGQLLGFHWTKPHPDGMGEVYVLGVAPEAQGMRLGAALLAAGLHHLAGRDVLLYVEGDNAPALHLYEKYGFVRHDLDVQLRR